MSINWGSRSSGSWLIGHLGPVWFLSVYVVSSGSVGEGNGTPLQYSCLENPMDGGAWWAAVCGVAQSQTLLKRLSSSSSKLCHPFKSCALPPPLQFQKYLLPGLLEREFPNPWSTWQDSSPLYFRGSRVQSYPSSLFCPHSLSYLSQFPVFDYHLPVNSDPSPVNFRYKYQTAISASPLG